MPGSPIRLGPFQGGLNTLSDPTAVADSELVDVVNFELDLDGSLTSRPPVVPLERGPSSKDGPALTNLVINPNALHTSGTVVVRKNYCPNPRASSGTTAGWSTAASGTPGVTLFDVVSDNFSGSQSAFSLSADRLGSTNDAFGVYFQVPAAPGEIWSARLDGIFRDLGLEGVVARMGIEFRNNSAGIEINWAPYHDARDSSLVEIREDSAVAPAGTTAVRLYVQIYTTGSVSEYTEFRFKNVLLEKSLKAGPFFDAASPAPSPDFTMVWTGATNLSASEMQAADVYSWFCANVFESTSDYQVSVSWTESGKAVQAAKSKGSNDVHYISSGGAFPLSAGKTVTALAKATASTAGCGLEIALQFLNSSNGTVSIDYGGNTPVTVANEVKELRYTSTPAPAGTVAVRLLVYLRSSSGNYQPPGGVDLTVGDALLVEGAYDGPFFSGNTVDSKDYRYDWVGPVDDSASTRTELLYDSIKLLGYYTAPNGTYYLVGSTDAGTYYFTGGAWTLITDTFNAVAMVQYNDKAWLLAPETSANPGGSWSPSAGFAAVAAMPKGRSIISHKNRLWVAPGKPATSNGSRIRFSDVTDPTVWDVNSFLDVSPGDGQNVTDIVVHQNSIMVFKNDSTYNYSYDSAPDKGTVSRISATQGASDVWCVVPYENTLFVYHEGNVYELINYNYSRISTKVPFAVDNSVPLNFSITVAMSLFNDRLIVRHFDRIYVFNLRTRTWSRWTSDRKFAYFIPEPKNSLITDTPTAYAGSCVTSDGYLYRIQDFFDADNTEEMTCYLRTKNYDYQISSNYKRLMWWGADVVSQGDVKVTANPIVYSASITWDQLENVTWDDIETWDQPLSALPTVTDAVPTAGAGSRKFLKFMKSLRFRQIYFEVSIDNDGTSRTAPCKLFNLTTFIQTKQTVSKTIS